MEYVDGPSTAELLREQRQLEVDETVRIVRDACHGLEYAHRAGVVHRDVKPGNLLLTADGILKLADFGIAKAAEQTRITQVGSVLGTAAYLSPEQAAGEEAGPASDLYSLGVCAYQFLTGRLPHEYGSLTELALKQQNEDVQPITDFRDDVPPSLDRAIRASLERDPSARYSNALEMADALEAGYRGEDTDTTRGIFSTGTEYATGGGYDTDATQALPRGNTMYQPPPSRRLAPATGTMAPSRYDEPPASAQRRERNWGKIVAGLLALALVAAAIYLAVGLGSRRRPDPRGRRQLAGGVAQDVYRGSLGVGNGGFAAFRTASPSERFLQKGRRPVLKAEGRSEGPKARSEAKRSQVSTAPPPP